MAHKKRSQITPKRRRSGLSHARPKPSRALNGEDALDPKDIEISTSSSPLSNEFTLPDRRHVEDQRDLSGDTQGLSEEEIADSESVAELVDEGQALEADAVEGVEEAPDPDESDVKVHSAAAASGPRNFKERNRL